MNARFYEKYLIIFTEVLVSPLELDVVKENRDHMTSKRFIYRRFPIHLRISETVKSFTNSFQDNNVE